MQHTIKQVTPMGEFTGKYGLTKKFLIIFEDLPDTGIQLNQKPETPVPQVGDKLEGTIDMSGQYGPTFKKAYGGESQFQNRGGGKPMADPKTMYVSYAKDIMVALIRTERVDPKLTYPQLIDMVAEEGLRLLGLTNKSAETLEIEAKVKEVYGDT